MKGGYDVLLLQETNCTQQKATADILGQDWHVYHDPTPRNTGRGVAIAVRRASCPELTNIQRGSAMREPAAAGRMITGDLIYATRDGRTQTIELTSFHVGFSDREETLHALGEHLDDCTTRAASPARMGVVRIAGGDGNGVWESSEVTWASEPGRTPTSAEQGLDFKACMVARKELANQKPPGTFPEALYTHEQKDCRKRIDYIFANKDLTNHVHHSRPEDENGVRTGVAEGNSLHHWVVADLPAAALGDALRPLARATYKPPRIVVNLTNKKELAEALEAAAPATATWEANLPPNVAAAFLAPGVLDATATDAQWAACHAALPQALSQIQELAVANMRRALNQPAPAPGRGPRPGRPLRNPIAPEAAQHRRAEVWLTKAARVARRVLTVRTFKQLPPYWARERAQLEQRWARCAYNLDTIAAAGWHSTAQCQPGLGLPTLTDLGAQPATARGPNQQQLPCVELLFTTPAHTLTAWVDVLWECKTKQTVLFKAAQGKVASDRQRELDREIEGELFHHGTGRARKLLAGRCEDAHSHGMAMLRDPDSQKVVVKPQTLEKIAVAHTRKLLGTSPPQPPTGKDWQREELWAPLKQRWTPAAREAATALATAADIQKIITKAKTGGAPGLDGIQYGVLKLLLRAGSEALLTMLTNLTNAVLRSPSLPEALGKSEIVYFYKKGDPADMNNYRGISLQSVLYKLAAAFTAAQLQSAAEALDLLSAAQVAARKGGRAADHVATMAAAIAHAHRTGQELHLLTCDIAKAFDEAPRAALLEALERHGYPAELIRRVQLLQTCTGARVRTRYGVSSAQVVTTRGCKQGCPLSPITYCLFTNMLLAGLQSSSIPGYAITPTGGATEPPDGQLPAQDAEAATAPTLDHQGYLDDLALFAGSATASMSQLAYANDFLQAYGMRFNTSKCRHSVANPKTAAGTTRVTLNTGWSPATPTGASVGETIPQTQSGGTFEYLGHHLTTDGDWTAQELCMTAKLTKAMRAVTIASGKGACGLLWTARLAEHDAVSTMPYYMATTALSASTLAKTLTAVARPILRKGGIASDHVSPLAVVGPPDTLKGLGVTHPEALDAAEKASTLFRLLNTPDGIGALAADGMRAHQRSSQPSRAYPKTAKHTRLPPTHTGGMAGLRRAPAGEAAWTIAENYRDFAATPVGDLCPALKHALGATTASTKSVRALLALTAGEALTIAAPRLLPVVPPCWREHAPVSISEAEEIVFARKVTRRNTAPNGLLTPRAQATLHGLHDRTRVLLLRLLAAELKALLTGPLAFTFVTRPGLLHLLHAARHGPHTGTEQPRALASEHVGVDGSYKVQPDGQKLAAGAVCYYRAAAAGQTEARLITCTFDGEQSSANAEMSSMTLALQTLSKADKLLIGWDLKPGVDTMHAALAQTRSAAEALAQPPAPAPTRDDATAAYYAHNPHMHRAVALASRDLAAGRERLVVHQAAHSQQGQDERVDEILTTTPGASVHMGPQRREYVVPPAALAALDAYFASRTGAPQAGTASHTRLVQNALADWAAKRVTVHGQRACTHLSPNTLSHKRWMVVDERGAIQQSDNGSLRRSVLDRVTRALVEARAARSPYLQTKLDLPALWASESTHALTLRTAGKRAALAAPANEHRTRYCFQMLCRSTLYAKDAITHTPALAEVKIDGNTIDLTCPLCQTADSDTKHHLFHECTATRAALDAMQRDITEAIRTASSGAITVPAAAEIASAATSRPDFFAGQIPKVALELLLAARRAAPRANGSGEQCDIPKTGAIQQLVLKHCKAIHDTRKRAVEAAVTAANTRKPKFTSPRDVHAFRRALWGTERNAAGVEASQQQQQAGPSPPPQQAAQHAPPRHPTRAPQQPSGLATSLNAQYAPLGMVDADVPGDGNCLLYAALGLSASACAGTDALRLAARIDALRASVIQHARGLSSQLKHRLGIYRAGAALADLRGTPTTVGQPTRWSLDYQAGAGRFMTDNVMHSLAATLDSDIVVIRTDSTGRIRATLDHFHARAWALADSAEPDGGPTMEAYSSVLWEEDAHAGARQGRQTRATSRRRPRQLTLRQLLTQRQAEQRRVTLIYSNGGDHLSGHFRAVIPRGTAGRH